MARADLVARRQNGSVTRQLQAVLIHDRVRPKLSDVGPHTDGLCRARCFDDVLVFMLATPLRVSVTASPRRGVCAPPAHPCVDAADEFAVDGRVGAEQAMVRRQSVQIHVPRRLGLHLGDVVANAQGRQVGQPMAASCIQGRPGPRMHAQLWRRDSQQAWRSLVAQAHGHTDRVVYV